MTVIVDTRTVVWNSPLDLRGQVAVITGGSSGIGLAVAQDLDSRGSRVVIASRSPTRVNEAIRSLRYAVGFPHCDVRHPDAVKALFDFVADQFGALDIVIMSAGIGRSQNTPAGRPRPVVSVQEPEWDDVIDTNLRGAFLTCRAVAPLMIRQRRGQIVNISSARGAVKGRACVAGYCASKMAVRAMFQSLAEELQPYGIRVMSILPDVVDTTLIAGAKVGPRGEMRPEDVGEFVGNMLAMPIDASFVGPVLVSLGAQN